LEESIFLPSIPVEASAHVEGATEERQPTKTVIGGGEGEDIDIFPRDERRRGAFRSDAHSVGEELKMLEDWLSNPGTEEDCQRDAVVKSEEEFQPEEQLDEAGLVPAQGEELTEGELSEEMVEQQLSSMVVEFGPVVEWKASATGDRSNMGDQIDLPIDLCEGVEALEERVIVQSHLIQQVKLETDEEEMQQRETAKEEPTSRPAGQSDRGDKEVDVGVREETINNKRKLNRGELQ
jgi:hypothetical protein